MEVIFCDLCLDKGKTIQSVYSIKYGPKVKVSFCLDCKPRAEKMANAKNTKPLTELLINLYSKVDEIFGVRKFE